MTLDQSLATVRVLNSSYSIESTQLQSRMTQQGLNSSDSCKPILKQEKKIGNTIL